MCSWQHGAGKFGASAAIGQVLPPKAQMQAKQDWRYVSGGGQVRLWKILIAHSTTDADVPLGNRRGDHSGDLLAVLTSDVVG